MNTPELHFLDALPHSAGRGNSRYDWAGIAAACRAHPGKWADVIQLRSRSGYHFNQARAQGLEVTGTLKQDGKIHIYVRWVQK